jgi:23S rRNA (adenine2503-C2)-methyltransferase
LREKFKAEAPLDIKAEVCESDDKRTVKAAMEFPGGIVETVLMRHDDRNTVCVSSQMGCKMACLFGLTGQGGFVRNLNHYEIVEQVLFFERYLSSFAKATEDKPEGKERVTNVVFMGMGEPFANYDEVRGS